MPDQLQLRGGTTTEHNSFTGVTKEVTVDTTKKTLVVHDGSTAGGTPLMRENGGNYASSVNFGTNGTSRFGIIDSEIVFNSTGADTDVRIAGSSESNLFRTDAANNKIGIGIATPNTLLHLSDGSPRITFTDEDTSVDHVLNADSSVGNFAIDVDANSETSDPSFIVNIKGDETLRIDSNGRLGIGVTSVDTALHIGALTNPALTLAGGAFSANVSTGGRSSIQAHIDIRSSSARGGVLVRNMNDFRNESDSASFMAYDPFDTTATTFAFRAAMGATLADTFYVKNNGDSYIKTKLGIGTASPSTALEISSNANAQTTATIPTVRLTNSDTVAAAADICGSFEFFTKDSSDTDHITAFVRSMSISNAGVNYDLAFGTKTTDVAGDATEKMRLLSNGNLGIGTTNPSAPLHIQKSGTSQNLLILQSDLGTNNGRTLIIGGPTTDSGSEPFRFSTANSLSFVIDSSDALRIHSDGKVGIGTTSPSAKLEVQDGSATGIISRCTSTQASDSNTAIKVRNNSDTNTFTVSYRGLGTFASSCTATAFNTPSDIALKKNIQPLANVIDKLKQITGYKYNYKSTEAASMGVMAQDVEKVFPELVNGEEGKKSLQYSGLIGPLIEAVKELSNKVAALEAA